MVIFHNIQIKDTIKYSGKVIVYKEDILDDKNIIAITDIQFPKINDS